MVPCMESHGRLLNLDPGSNINDSYNNTSLQKYNYIIVHCLSIFLNETEIEQSLTQAHFKPKPTEMLPIIHIFELSLKLKQIRTTLSIL